MLRLLRESEVAWPAKPLIADRIDKVAKLLQQVATD